MRLVHNKISSELEQKIIGLYQEHYSPKNIGKLLNISRSTIHNVIARNNIPTRFKICNIDLTEKRCTKCLLIRPIERFGNNKSFQQTGKTSICRSCINDNLKIYRNKNGEKIRERNRNLAKKHRKENKQYIIAQNLRRRTRHVIYMKTHNTLDLLGCDILFFIQYLESLFKPGMTWQNYGNKINQWNIDHIKPCKAFNLELPDEQKKCFHYSNMRPLWASENFSKSDNYP